jgi:hypothetical protein
MGRSDETQDESELAEECKNLFCIPEPHTTADPRCVSGVRPVDEELVEIDPDDPRTFVPGLEVRYLTDDKVYVLKARKDDDSGWWLEGDAGGIDDRVWAATGNWVVNEAGPGEDDDAEITDIGFDPDAMSAEEIEAMVTLMHDSNQVRVAALEEKAGPGNQGSLENAFDGLRMLVFLEQIAYKLEISALANLDFEGRRAKMIDGIEAKYAAMLKAQQAAQRAARLAGGGGPPGGPPPGSGPRPMRRG